MSKIALVTGGNRGIGFEVCKELAKRGMRVVLASRDLEKGDAAAALLHDQTLINVVAHQLDVANEESRLRMVETIERDFGRLDVLVNNAGVFIDRPYQLSNVDLDLMRQTLEINSFGALRLIQLFAPMMRAQRWGRVVNVSSSLGQLEGLDSSYPAYRLSKVALNLFTRLLAEDFRGTGIKINAVSPGWVRSDMGGPGAPRTIQQGADTVVWLATLPDDGPSGGFFLDREQIEW